MDTIHFNYLHHKLYTMNYIRQIIYLTLLVLGSILISNEDGSIITIGIIVFATVIFKLKPVPNCTSNLRTEFRRTTGKQL